MSKFPGWGSIFNKKSNSTNSQEVSSLFKNVSLNENAPLQQVPNQEKVATQNVRNTQSYTKEKEDDAPNYVIGMDPNRKTYHYTGNDEYLNEDGRNNDHLYIGPGEPLVPQKRPKVPQNYPRYQNTYGANNLDNQPQNPSFSYQEGNSNFIEPKINTESSAPFNTPKPSPQYQDDSHAFQIKAQAFVEPYAENTYAPNEQRIEIPNGETESINTNAFTSRVDKAPNTTSINSSMFDSDSLPPKIDSPKEQKAEDQNSSFMTSRLKVFLFIRQLIASFFTHTTLNIFAPKLSLSFGPTYPSSMPLPYFFIGLILGAICSLFNDMSPVIVPVTPFILAIFLIITGIQGFRGCGTLISIFSQRRADSYMKIITVFILSVLFCFCLNFCLAYKLCNASFSIVLASVLMLSAYTATTLNFALDGDPVDSYGSLSLKGLLISGGICFIVLFLCLSFALAISLIGVSLLVRMIIGFYLNLHKARASRDIICGMQYLTMLVLFMDMLILHLKLNLPLYGFLINYFN